MTSTPLGRLRLLGLIEGWSFVILLLVAMPLKYLAGLPLAVRIVGSAHGALFVLYCIYVLNIAADRDWPFKRTLLALGASVVPLGTFFFDRSLKAEQAADTAGATPSSDAEPA